MEVPRPTLTSKNRKEKNEPTADTLLTMCGAPSNLHRLDARSSTARLRPTLYPGTRLSCAHTFNRTQLQRTAVAPELFKLWRCRSGSGNRDVDSIVQNSSFDEGDKNYVEISLLGCIVSFTTRRDLSVCEFPIDFVH